MPVSLGWKRYEIKRIRLKGMAMVLDTVSRLALIYGGREQQIGVACKGDLPLQTVHVLWFELPHPFPQLPDAALDTSRRVA